MASRGHLVTARVIGLLGNRVVIVHEGLGPPPTYPPPVLVVIVTQARLQTPPTTDDRTTR